MMNPTLSSSVLSDAPAEPSAVCDAPDLCSYKQGEHYTSVMHCRSIMTTIKIIIMIILIRIEITII